MPRLTGFHEGRCEHRCIGNNAVRVIVALWVWAICHIPALQAQSDPAQLINDSLSQVDLATAYDPADSGNCPGGVFSITATFENISADVFAGIYFDIVELTPPHRILNADASGSTQIVRVPPSALGPDNVLTEHEQLIQVLDVCLGDRSPFNLFVDVYAAINTPPVADAGPDQTRRVGDMVVLDGGASTDVDGDALSYHWLFVAIPRGSTADLADATLVNPSFTVDLQGRYEAQLTVNDGRSDSAPDTVVIDTENSPPVADAGVDQRVPLNQLVTLDGSDSSDVDGDQLTFSWVFVSTPPTSSADLSDATTVTPTFTPDVAGTYVAGLVVNDGEFDSLSDTVTATTINTIPIADAGFDQTARLNETVMLDGTGSIDADGNTLTFAWSLTTPAGSNSVLDDPAAVMPTFDVDATGRYVAQLIVNDGQTDSLPDTVAIDTRNSAPVADAGDDRDVSVGDLVSLDGSDSFDVDNDPLTYSWSLISAPPGSTATIANPGAATTSFAADLAGEYVAQLIVSDGELDSTPATVLITAMVLPAISIGDVTLDEGDAGTTTFTFTVTLSEAVVGGASVDYVVADGSATEADNDYVGAAGTLNFAGTAGETRSINVTVNGDLDVEPNEVFFVDLNNAMNATLVDARGEGTIVNDDVPIITITASDAAAAEAGPDPGTFTLTRSGGTEDPLIVRIAVGGSATELADYGNLQPSVVFGVGESSVEVLVTPRADNVIEGNESVDLTIAPAPTYDIAPPGSATVIIADDPIVVTVDATDPDASEIGPDEGTFRFTRQGGDQTSQLAVPYSISGTATETVDYGNLTRPVIIPAGAASADLNVVPVRDADPNEGPESVTVAIDASTDYRIGGSGAATVTIADDDTLSLTLTPANLNLLTGALGGFTLTLSTPAGAGGQLVNLGSSDTAVATAPATVTVPEGDTTIGFDVTAGTTAGVATITALAAGFASGTATVNVSDRAMLLAVDSTLIGAGRTTGGTVTLSQPAPAGGVPITLGSTNAGVATVTPALVTIPQGDTQAVFTVSGVAVGNATITGNAQGFTQATVDVTVTTLLVSFAAVPPVAPGQRVSLPVSLTAPAPPGGVTVSMTSGDPSIATVTPSVFIDEGNLTPAANPQVTGLRLGTAQITGTAPGFAPGSVNAVVTLNLAFTPDRVTLVEATTANVTLNLSAPAPAPGLTISLTTDDTGVATVPTSVTVPTGQTSIVVPVTATAPGSTTLRATSPGIAEETATVTVTPTPPTPPITVGDTNLGDDLQTSLTGALGAPAPSGGLQVTITSNDPGRLLVSSNDNTPGSASIVVQIAAGNSGIPRFYVQALADSGTETITLSAPGYATGASTVTLMPSGFAFVPPALDTTTLSGPSNVQLRAVRLNPNTLAPAGSQVVRPGLTVDVDVASTNPTVGTITSPAVFNGNENRATVVFNPQTAGVTDLNISSPPGFETPSRDQTIVATVTAPAIDLADFVVGDDLQRGRDLTLGVAPSVPTDVTLTVTDPTIAAVSNSATVAGAAQVTFPGVTSRGVGTVFIQGLQRGTTSITVTAAGYQTRVANITVDPSGFTFVAPALDTTTFSGPSNVMLRAARLNPATLAPAGTQAIRPGLTVNVDVVSSNPTVGTITSPAVFNGNDIRATVVFDPLTAGTTNLSVIQPAGFETPTGPRQTIAATVTAPAIDLADFVVGDDLQTNRQITLGIAPPTPTDVVLTVADPTVAAISSSETVAGAAQVIFSGVTGAVPGRVTVQGLQQGATTLAVAAAGYQTRVVNITVNPSGFVFQTNAVNTTTFSDPSNVTLRSVRLNPGSNNVNGQAVRAGLTVNVDVTSSDPAVGTITTPAVFDGGENRANVVFDPLTAGTTNLSLTQPLDFEAPPASQPQTIVATVTAPGIDLDDSVVGEDLQLPRQVSLLVAPPGPTTVTVTVAAPSIATVSTDPSVEGSNSVTFDNVTSRSVGTVYVQGRSQGSTILTVQAAGYSDRIANVRVDPSGFVIVTGNFSVGENDANRLITLRVHRLNPTTLNRSQSQPIRGGLTVSVPLVNSNPAAGILLLNPVIFDANVAVATVDFDPQAAGVTSVSLDTPAGFDTPNARQQVSITVTAAP